MPVRPGSSQTPRSGITSRMSQCMRSNLSMYPLSVRYFRSCSRLSLTDAERRRGASSRVPGSTSNCRANSISSPSTNPRNVATDRSTGPPETNHSIRSAAESTPSPTNTIRGGRRRNRSSPPKLSAYHCSKSPIPWIPPLPANSARIAPRILLSLHHRDSDFTVAQIPVSRCRGFWRASAGWRLREIRVLPRLCLLSSGFACRAGRRPAPGERKRSPFVVQWGVARRRAASGC